jgi:hypothetical protein
VKQPSLATSHVRLTYLRLHVKEVLHVRAIKLKIRCFIQFSFLLPYVHLMFIDGISPGHKRLMPSKRAKL